MKGREAIEAKMGEMKRTRAVLSSDPRRTSRPVTKPIDRLRLVIVFIKKGGK